MAEKGQDLLVEELYRLVETVAEGVSANARRLDLLAVEIARLKEGQTRSEMLLRRLEGEFRGLQSGGDGVFLSGEKFSVIG